jgi:hypothetical protein
LTWTPSVGLSILLISKEGRDLIDEYDGLSTFPVTGGTAELLLNWSSSTSGDGIDEFQIFAELDNDFSITNMEWTECGSSSSSSNSSSSSSSSSSSMIPSAGLWSTPPVADPTSSTMSIETGFTDGDYSTEPQSNWNTYTEAGVDMGESMTLTGMKFYNNDGGAVGVVTDWYAGPGGRTVALYTSNDNSTWTFIENFDGPPLFDIADGVFNFEITFSSPQTARYFKIWSGNTGFFTNVGFSVPVLTEIEVVM